METKEGVTNRSSNNINIPGNVSIRGWEDGSNYSKHIEQYETIFRKKKIQVLQVYHKITITVTIRKRILGG